MVEIVASVGLILALNGVLIPVVTDDQLWLRQAIYTPQTSARNADFERFVKS